MHRKKGLIIGMTCLCLLFSQTYIAYGISNKAIHWGFKKARNEQPAEAGDKWDEIIEKHRAFYKGDPHKKELYLTFDNGYENGFTEKVLQILKEEKVAATFFVTGHYLESAAELVKRMDKEGHTIGNHSWSHPDLTKVSDEQLFAELEKVRKKTEALTGKQTMNYIRPPRGIFSERTLALANKAGYTHVFWSLAFVDWHVDKQKGWTYAYDEVMKQVHPGAILLLHTVSKDNADALQKIIRDLKAKGYTFKRLDDLMMDHVLDGDFP